MSKESFWNDDYTRIFTLNEIEVFHELKGNATDRIFIRTEGGKVGATEVTVSHQLQLSVGQQGIYFCNVDPDFEDNVYRVYSSSQGFFSYSPSEDRMTAPFVDMSIPDLDQRLLSHGLHTPNRQLGISKLLPPPVDHVIEGFEPQELVAGVFETVTIYGSGFGNTGPDELNYVAFPYADDGGASWVQAAPTDYQSWNDSTITLFVPKFAGSGKIQVVINESSETTSEELSIPFAIGNGFYPRDPAFHYDFSGNGGYIFTKDIGFITDEESAAFDRAVETWVCQTGIYWEVNPNWSAVGPASDGVNSVSWYSWLPAGTLSSAYVRASQCESGLRNIEDLDIAFSFSSGFDLIPWYSGTGNPGEDEYDFESAVLHELGHCHFLQHVNDVNDPMYFDFTIGQTNRILHPNNVRGAHYMRDLSLSPNSCDLPMTSILQQEGCLPDLDAALTVIDVPGENTCAGVHPVEVELYNLGSDTIYTAIIDWTVNNEPQEPYFYVSPLLPDENSGTLFLGEYNFEAPENNIRIWVREANSQAEINTENDLITVTFYPDPCLINNSGILEIYTFPEYHCPSDLPLIVSFENAGLNNVGSVTFEYYLNDELLGTSNWVASSGSLSTDESIEGFEVGEISFDSEGTYEIEVVIVQTNGQNDIALSNNIATLTHIVQCPDRDVEALPLNLPEETCPLEPVDIPLCFKNLGQETLESIEAMIVLDGEMIYSETWQGELALGDSICITGFNFSAPPIDFQLEYSLANPNGLADQISSNNFQELNYQGTLLSGLYTLGGTDPDFHTFTELAQKLNENGVCGPVIIEVRDGVYDEQFILNEPPGLSEENNITIRSESQNPNNVILHHANPVDTSYTLGLFASSHIHFEAMSIGSYPSSLNAIPQNCRVIKIDSISHHLSFANNIIETSWNGGLESPDLEYSRCIDIGNENTYPFAPEHISFENNRIKGGEYSFYLSGTVPGLFANLGKAKSIDIINNTFEITGSYGVSLGLCQGLNVEGNQFIWSGTDNEQISTLRIHDCLDSLNISNNRFTSKEGLAVEIDGFESAPEEELNLFNNEIYIQNGQALVISDCEDLSMIHNTIVVGEMGQVNESTVQLDDLDDALFMNNLVVNYGMGKALSISSMNPSPENFDHNNFFSNGDVLIEWNEEQGFNTLEDFQSETGLDQNSHQLDPEFLGDSPFVPQNNVLNDLGSQSDYDFDLFYNSRGVNPDIGAIEFELWDNDAGITELQVSLGMECTSGELIVDITNYGQIALEQCYIHWSDNGIEDSVLFVGSIAPNSSESDYLLTTIELNAFEERTIEAWTSMPNGVEDEFPYNDLRSINVNQIQLNGSYTVGGPLANFQTMDQAVDALRNLGVCGPVIMNILPGQYGGSWELGQIEGLSELNNLTFQSATEDAESVELVGSLDSDTLNNYIFKLDAQGFTSIKSLSFTNPAATNDFSSIIINEGTNYLIQNCLFNDPEDEALDLNHILVEALDNMSDLEISDCVFNHSNTAIRVRGNNLSTNLTIRGNESLGELRNGMIFEDLSGLSVSDNDFQASERVMRATGVNSPFEILTNYLISFNDQTTSSSLINCNGSEFDPIKVYNNIIISQEPIVMDSCHHVQIYHNTLNNFASSIITLQSTGSSHFGIVNNIFNTSGPFLNWTGDLENVSSDYNAFRPSFYNYLILNGVQTNFSNWGLDYGQDQNSIFTTVDFVGDGDYHVNNELEIDGMATYLPEVSTDLDNEPRDPESPDIGADEFDVNWNELYDLRMDSVYVFEYVNCEANDSTFARLRNISDEVINYMEIEWELDGLPQENFVFEGNWSSNTTRTFYLGAPAYPTNEVQITARAILPNGYNDADESNNSFERTHQPLRPINLIVNDLEICSTEQTTAWVSGGSGQNFTWSNGWIADTILVNQEQTLIVENNQFGCILSDSVEISVIEVFDEISILPANPALCPGEETVLTYEASEGAEDIQWSTGSIAPGIIAQGNEWVSIEAIDGNGCPLRDSIYIPFLPPIQPQIEINEDLITASEGLDYIWFFNGDEISGQNSDSLIASSIGEYYAEVMDPFGCWYTSNTVTYLGTDLVIDLDSKEFLLQLVQKNLWQISSPSSSSHKLSLFDVRGALIESQLFRTETQVDLNSLATGIYILRIDDETHRLMKY